MAFWGAETIVDDFVDTPPFRLDLLEDFFVTFYLLFFDPGFLSPKKWILFKPTNDSPSALYCGCFKQLGEIVEPVMMYANRKISDILLALRCRFSPSTQISM